jgi:CBS domain containing-hemolysin-like protein
METAFIIFVVTSVLIFVNGLYVAAEFSAIHARPTRIRQLAANGNTAASYLESVINNPRRLDSYIAACKIGVTLSSLVLGFYGQWVIARRYAPLLLQAGWLQTGMAQIMTGIIVLVLLTLLQTVLGELLPKSIALRHAEPVALFAATPLRWSITFFRPAIMICNGIAALVLGLFRVPPAMRRQSLSPEEIEQLAMESARWGLIEADERQLLHNALRVGELTAARVMVPRTRMVAASLDTPLPELLQLATASGRSRIPLYNDSIDDIVGSVHIKDLFRLHSERRTYIQEVLRTVSYVPKKVPALAVWNQLKQEGNYIAVVLDEFGGTAGMITVADLLEEIFGELQDEFDTTPQPSLMTTGYDGCLRLQGDMRITDINERFGLKLPDEEVNTIGGLAMTTLGRLPRVGDEIPFERVTLRVEAVNGPAVLEVCLFFKTATEEIPLQEHPGEEQ